MKKIPLRKGKYAIVDDEDYPYLSRFHWSVSNNHAAMQVGHTNVFMEFLVKEKGKGTRYIFINRNTLDCRKQNIEVVGWGSSSAFSKKTNSKTSSKYKGVYWDKRSKMWFAYLTVRKDNKRVKLLWKTFHNEDDAARCRNAKAKEIFGELTYQNKI